MNLLLWLDAAPARYDLAACAALAVTLGLALAAAPGGPPRPRALAARWLFCASLFVTLFAFRWPLYPIPRELSIDASQTTAQALTFERYPVPWKDYDTTTSGPLDSIALAAPSLLGVRPGFASGRIVATLLLGVLAVMIYAILRLLTTEFASRIAILPLLAFFCTEQSFELADYTTELLPSVLLTWAGLALLIFRRARSPAAAFFAGLPIGAAPFAKLQAVPPAAVLTLAAVALIASGRRDDGSATRRGLAAFAAGLAAVPLALLVPVFVAGAGRDFFLSYVVMVLEVAQRRPPFFDPANFLQDPFIDIFVLGSTLAAVVAALWLRRTRAALPRNVLVVLALTILASLYAAWVPRSSYLHYLWFFLVSFGTLAALLVAEVLASAAGRALALRASVLCIVLVLVVPLVWTRAAIPMYLGHLTAESNWKPGPVQAMLRANVAPGQRMAIWGWMPSAFVTTGALLGTRDSLSEFQLERLPLRDYYRARYLDDLNRNRPAFFLDAVAPGAFAYACPQAQGHETFARLAALIDANYRLVANVEGIRLYRRSDDAWNPGPFTASASVRHAPGPPCVPETFYP